MKTQNPERSWRASSLKRAADIGGAAVMLVATSPVIVTTAAAKWMEDGKNPFYASRRSGKGGEPFTMYKIRTLHTGNHVGIGKGPEDPRATKIGLRLRRYGIDELPQLVNIALGHMSFTGHRPVVAAEVQAIEEAHAKPDHQEAYTRWREVIAAERPGIVSTYSMNTRFIPHDKRDADEYFRTRVQADIVDHEQASPMHDARLVVQAAKLIGHTLLRNFR